jgi:uncharacterized protein DUF6152
MGNNPRTLSVITIMAGAISMAAAPAFAHHPFATEFDWMKPVTLTGTVMEVRWGSPHATIAIEVRDSGKPAVAWLAELGSPAVLEKNYDWSRDAVKIGDSITIDGWLGKDERKFVSAKSITLGNGKQLFGASSFFDLPGRCISDKVCVEAAPSSFYEEFAIGQR